MNNLNLNEKTLWEAVLTDLKLTLSELKFNMAFAKSCIKNLTSNSVDIYVKTALAKTKAEGVYKDILQESLNTIMKTEVTFRVFVEEDETVKPVYEETPLFKKTATKTTDNEEDFVVHKTNLDNKYTFENYLNGPNNQVACAIAQAIAENPGNAYNPFFLYAGVGLGKTHLLQAIGNKIVHTKPNLKVLYCTGESFTYDLIEALRGGNKKYSNMVFKKKYRDVDVFLIDDVQFIAGKDSTQDEFFHTFNNLLMGRKQVVLTSDRPPKDFTNLEDRIKSRFGSGMIANIQSPDYEMRLAILKTKREKDQSNMPDEVLEYLAEVVDSNVRELEGAYIKIWAEAKTTNQFVSKDLAQKTMGDTIKHKQAKPVNVNTILKAVANYYSVTITDIKGKKRTKELVTPRQMAMYLMYNLTETPFMSIGELLGGRDHTTVMHGVRKIEEEAKTMGKTKQDSVNIKQTIMYN